MNTLALSLAAARAMLQMNVKSVASAIQISDRTITKMENDADELNHITATLIQFYEDCGLSFQRDANGDIIGVIASPDLKRITLIFSDQADPSERIKEVRHALRQIRGVVSKTYSTDRSTAAPEDTIELHIPVETRPIAIKSLSNLLKTNKNIDYIDKSGVKSNLTVEKLVSFFE